jgi:hypothetical protein
VVELPLISPAAQRTMLIGELHELEEHAEAV